MPEKAERKRFFIYGKMPVQLPPDFAFAQKSADAFSAGRQMLSVKNMPFACFGMAETAGMVPSR